MNTSDLTLQMAYLAGQIAQSTLPDIGVSAGRPEQKMDFQALLNEKRTQADRERTERSLRRQIRPKIQRPERRSRRTKM